MNWLFIAIAVPVVLAVAWWFLRRHRRKLDVSTTSTWPSEHTERAGQHEGVTIPMSQTAIYPQDEGGSPPPVPAPVQLQPQEPQEVEEVSPYQAFCRDLENYVKHQPHNMFSQEECEKLFKTYERGLVKTPDQSSHTLTTGQEHEVEDGGEL